MIQSLVRKGNVNDLVARYGHVIVDECHHLPAVSFERVLAEVKGRYVTGLTATPYRRDGHQPIIHMQLGPVRFASSRQRHATEQPFEQRLILRETNFGAGDLGPDAGIQEIYAVLAANEDRNMLSFDDVLKSLEEGRSPVLLTERKDHLDLLAERFRKFTRHLVVLKGGLTARKRKEAMERLASIPNDEERLVLATGRYIGEGFDDTRLDTLFLTLPVSWKGTLVQYAGRLHRHRPGKREVRIYDYVDRNVPILARMAEGGSKPPVVDEFDDREEIVEPILQGRPGEDQGEARAQPLDDAAGLRLTVLDRSRPRRRCRPSGRAADRRQEAFGEADGMPGLCGSAR